MVPSVKDLLLVPASPVRKQYCLRRRWHLGTQPNCQRRHEQNCFHSGVAGDH